MKSVDYFGSRSGSAQISAEDTSRQVVKFTSTKYDQNLFLTRHFILFNILRLQTVKAAYSVTMKIFRKIFFSF